MKGSREFKKSLEKGELERGCVGNVLLQKCRFQPLTSRWGQPGHWGKERLVFWMSGLTQGQDRQIRQFGKHLPVVAKEELQSEPQCCVSILFVFIV